MIDILLLNVYCSRFGTESSVALLPHPAGTAVCVRGGGPGHHYQLLPGVLLLTALVLVGSS